MERDDGGKLDGRVVEGDEPDAEDLEDVNVEDKVRFVKGCSQMGQLELRFVMCFGLICIPTDCTLMSMRGLMILYHR